MSNLILLNKPFHVLSQFSPMDDKETLAKYIKQKGVYPAGRLDYDSEGLLLLTDDGQWQHKISHPNHKEWKTYYVQVDGDISEESIIQLRSGVELKDGKTKPAKAERVDEPIWLWERSPPIRQRNNDILSWIKLSINEGKNRQVRRMTAAVGHGTLRLIRYSIGDWTIEEIKLGEHKTLTVPTLKKPDLSNKKSFPAGNKSSKRSNYKHKKTR